MTTLITTAIDWYELQQYCKQVRGDVSLGLASCVANVFFMCC